mmetsp:Transcript_4889/g.11659  ORF Transcript_4889/g.11659 Transcript_4889/m.11659 type:complete len:314 (-) Transcript_4889:400-1341(-)
MPCGVRELQVAAGSWRREELSTTSEERRVRKIFVHPLYQQIVVNDYDFALMQLDKALPLNACIGLACLPRSEEITGTECSITGWGALQSSGPRPEVLQEAPVTLLDSLECEANYTADGKTVTGSMLCASGVSDLGITDTCQGDSGGPLVCRENGRFVVRGVTSWGHGCAFPNLPGVYSRVRSVVSWIDDVLAGQVLTVYAQDEHPAGVDFKNSMWAVVQGNCTLDSFNCILSPHFPANYGNSESCQIAVNTSAAVPIRVANFSTEFGVDKLSFGCLTHFSGKNGPEGVIPQTTISWFSDGSIVSSGWKLCPST